MSKLYLVPTPIGNLEDITLRALRILKEEVALILAEDTRKTGILLKHYSISKPMSAFHQHNEHQQLERLIDRLQAGETMALVTDAGTPAISDPGFCWCELAFSMILKWNACPAPLLLCRLWSIRDCPPTALFLKAFCRTKKAVKPA